MGIKRTTIKLLGNRPKTHYTAVPNALILDTDLTSDARLLGIYLRSLPDGWEINQEQIAAALGWPTNSKRVVNARRNLIERGWLRHTERRGPRGGVYQHEYAMLRDRRFNGVESTPVDEPASTTSRVKSTPVTRVESTPLPKEQSNQETAAADRPQPIPDEEPIPTAVSEVDFNPWDNPDPSSETPAAKERPGGPWASLDELFAAQPTTVVSDQWSPDF
ncbi:hypothetical protein [Mycolicibacterium smegmatis]|uniref:Helix-turn-helix domain-containing protein n=1 Tax=Mycolicibacterium smegmatis (strain MKD8) TaxID=1214915 RepID=A0A2U9PLG6_MYCSE|nr:hypothetical protein [Mycolicibacterium smegmatis]AWT52589.1 hypothetical protein D806_016050 [Mycolicibacterium smegmatis MKD8]